MSISLSEIKKMVKLANHLDSLGLYSEADTLDQAIQKYAQDAGQEDAEARGDIREQKRDVVDTIRQNPEYQREGLLSRLVGPGRTMQVPVGGATSSRREIARDARSARRSLTPGGYERELARDSQRVTPEQIAMQQQYGQFTPEEEARLSSEQSTQRAYQSPTAPAAAAPAAPTTPTGRTPPVPAVYTVQRGDTLGAIAKRFGLSVELLKRENSIQDVNKIEVGQQIKLPGLSRVGPADPTGNIGAAEVVLTSSLSPAYRPGSSNPFTTRSPNFGSSGPQVETLSGVSTRRPTNTPDLGFGEKQEGEIAK